LDSIVIGGYFFVVTPNSIPIRQQSALSTKCHDNHLDVCGAAVVSRWRQGGVECKLYIVTIIEFWDFTWYTCTVLDIFRFRSIHCSATHYYMVLVSLEANIIGYFVLGALLGIILTLVLAVACFVEMLQALQRASHIISEIRETHLWW